MADKKVLELTEHQKDIFNGFLAKRDDAALRAGVAALECQKIMNTMNAVIEQNLREERALVNKFAAENGIDVSQVNFKIDYQAGLLIEI